MKPARVWWLRLLGMLRRDNQDLKSADQSEHPLHSVSDDNARNVLSPGAAPQGAVLRADAVESERYSHRDRLVIPWLETLWHDAVRATRTMRSQAGFTATVVLTAAIGIGGTTAIFTIVNGVMLRPLPYPQPERLVYINRIIDGRVSSMLGTRDFSAMRSEAGSLLQMAGYFETEMNLSVAGRSERVTSGLATRTLFELLGVQPALGRNFLPEEDAPGGPNAVLISDEFWRRQFAADPVVLGKAITLNGTLYTIVGVLPLHFRVPSRFSSSTPPAVWLPFAIEGQHAARDQILLWALGRLKDGATLEQASAELTLLHPKRRDGRRPSVVVSRWQDEITQDARKPLWMFLSTAGFVLLIACVNVANLLLSRAATRDKEMVIRCALGASRGRLMQQLLIESALLGLLGGLLGLLVSLWGTRLLTAFLGPNLPAIDPTGIDYRVLSFNVALSLLTGVAFGLAPAWQAAKSDLTSALKESSRSVSEVLPRRRLRGLLVVLEVAVATVLLCSAGLLLRSYSRLRGLDGGYRPERILMCSVDLNESQYPTTVNQVEYFRRALERASGLPGVQSAGLAISPPLISYGFALTGVEMDGLPVNPTPVHVSTVSPSYFRTIGIPLLQGRDLAGTDHKGNLQVALVNEAFSRRYCPDRRCVGRRIKSWYGGNEWISIVGVVGDLRQFPDKESEAVIYPPYMQSGGLFMTIVVRTTGDPAELAPVLRAAIAGVDRTKPPERAMTLDEARDTYLTPRRVQMTLVLAFAVLALGLGSVGVYGVVSYTVKRRTHEIGIRSALGAGQFEVFRLIAKSGLSLVGVGVGIGALASLAFARVISSELWGVSSADPLTFAVVAAVLLTTGFAACLLPARRAMKMDPLVSLRCE